VILRLLRLVEVHTKHALAVLGLGVTALWVTAVLGGLS
jgi:hypothetical protein